MFRLTQMLRELKTPTPVRPRRDPPGPVVIWNLIRRCNLKCKHCYSVSADVDFPGELATPEVLAVMDDLKAFRVPALILSGGEPLLRPDIFDISRRAKAMGFYTALSSNGALIDEDKADRIAEIGYDYVGISLDGIGATNDRFRGLAGAYDAALSGVRACVARGVKVGLRFTMTLDNWRELPRLIDLAEREGVRKFYLSHLVYAGRGNKNRGDDANWRVTRDMMDFLIDAAWAALEKDEELDFVTGNNDADGGLALFLDLAPFPRTSRTHARETGAMGRQFLRRQCRQYRQSRRRPPRHDVAGHSARQCPRPAVLANLDRCLRPGHGRAEAPPARNFRALRRLRLFRYLRRQYARAGVEVERRRVRRRPGLLSHRRRNRRARGRAPRLAAVPGNET